MKYLLVLPAILVVVVLWLASVVFLLPSLAICWVCALAYNRLVRGLP